MILQRAALVAVAAIAASAVGALSSAAGTAASPSFELVFDAHRETADFSPVGFVGVGPFTASGEFCPSGHATTFGVRPDPGAIQLDRLLTCSDGTGSATAIVSFPAGAFEDRTGGSWRIVAGTDRYTRLRGRGTFRSVRISGDSSDPLSVTYRSTWTGVADHDDVAPALAISRASVTKLRRPVGSYVLRLAFSARDASGSAVGYHVVVTGKGVLEGKSGTTASGNAAAAIRLKAAKGVRRLRVEITATDPVGNESRMSRSVAIPR